MAEIFGIVTGALSVAALFNNCVDCFEYIQLGRRFGSDYQRCQLKLDVAKMRLAKWGKDIHINDDPRFVTMSLENGQDDLVQLAQRILVEIIRLLEVAYKKSKHYEMKAKPEDLILYEQKELKPFFLKLQNPLRELARQQQKNTSLILKTRWALYDKKDLDEMIDKIMSSIDDLENNLKALQDTAKITDNVLSKGLEEKVQGMARKNEAKHIELHNKARIQVGDYDSTAGLHGSSIRDQTTNLVGEVVANGDSRIQIGQIITTNGGKSIWDD